MTGKELSKAARDAFIQYGNQTIPKVKGKSGIEGMDCGGFLIYCYRQCGETLKMKGTNDMFRRPSKWSGTIETARREHQIKDGSLAFIVKNDGGEKTVGYYDGKGNSVCVGIVSENAIIYYSGDNKKICKVRLPSRIHKDWWSHIVNVCGVEYA